MGVKPGTNFRLLTEGTSVTLDNGTIITPDQVLDLPSPSESFIINFIPDESFVESVVSNKDYEPYFESNIDQKINNLSVVFHSSN